MVERVIQTIKNKLFKTLDYNNTKRYTLYIDQVVKTYNLTAHTGLLGLTPDLTHKIKESGILNDLSHVLYLNKFNNYSPRHLYKKQTLGPASLPHHTLFNVGDYVRIQNSSADQAFFKSYLLGHSKEIFQVRKIYSGPLKYYRLSDLKGEHIDGVFYLQELKKVILPNSYQIERILGTKKIKKITHHLVKFKGWPEKFNEWLPVNSVFQI